MQFSFSSNAFRNFSLQEAAEHISIAGYAGLEIMCDTPHAWPYHLSKADVADIKRFMAKQDLEIANLNAFMMCAVQDFHHPSWIEADRDFRRQRIEYTIRCIRLAEKLGVPTISTEPGGPVNGMRRELAMEIFMDGLAQVTPHAVNCGVTVLIEPEPGLLIETADEFVKLIHGFGSDGIGLNFDVGHFYCVNEDPCLKIAELQGYIRHFHLEDIPLTREHRHIMLGEGGIDISKVLDQINTIGYNGYVTVELYPYQETAPEIAKRSRRFLRRLEGCA
ncbi:sugar phosphate isomerase/epimerase family protein [Desulfosarcina ovata]|uniref:AP endonuclease n=1 Tax=Desulfosarcina ovata subsp. ovata TaxID=2752305 RepID=A0A5K8A527_9BACT|nr:sugar phosphate isomerase/epimerase family protein [Desulfosarcina ovata]BBO87577.1 AP endonuclease [Desulfosarcina ovata subsp. ovata]